MTSLFWDFKIFRNLIENKTNQNIYIEDHVYYPPRNK